MFTSETPKIVKKTAQLAFCFALIPGIAAVYFSWYGTMFFNNYISKLVIFLAHVPFLGSMLMLVAGILAPFICGYIVLFLVFYIVCKILSIVYWTEEERAENKIWLMLIDMALR